MTAKTVAHMTAHELQTLVEASLERKLLELLGDPDAGLKVRKAVRDQLLQQKRAVEAGERGTPLHTVARRLKLR